MDSKTKAEVDKLLVGAGVKAPNEARLEWDLPPAKGGDTPYLQQQNYSLAALAKRDEMGPPPAASAGSPSPPTGDGPEADPDPDDDGQEGADARALSLPWSGVYDAAKEYPKGSMVTYKRALWLAPRRVQAGIRPGTVAGAWRLACLLYTSDAADEL